MKLAVNELIINRGKIPVTIFNGTLKLKLV